MGGSSGGRARRAVGRSGSGRLLPRLAAVLVVWGLLLVPVAGPGGAQPARADDGTAVASVDPRAPQTAACSTAVTVDCTRRLDFRVGRVARSAYVYLPPAAAASAVPMVVVVHGLRMTPRSMDDATGWTALARREGFAVTFPQGYGEKPGPAGYQASWNAGTCCGPAVTC